jgi:hypothetical protein
MPKAKPKRRKRSTKVVIQEHHITYNPEWTVIIYKGEHYLLSQLQWRKRFSKGFITSLKDFIRIHEPTAFDLGPGKGVPPPEHKE